MYLFPLRPCGPGSRRVCSARLDEFLWLSGSGLGVCCLVLFLFYTFKTPARGISADRSGDGPDCPVLRRGRSFDALLIAGLHLPLSLSLCLSLP